MLWCAVARAEDIPKLSLAPPSKAKVSEGKQKNIAALTLHRAKKYDAAVAGYIEALRSDPSNTIARYNLASVLATKGDTKRALEVLAQFQVAACDYCLQRLRDAQADKEWQPLWADARFKQIVAMAAAPAPAPAGKGGPAAPIADVQIETADNPDRVDDPKPLAADRIRVHVWTAIEPGFYGSPKVDVVLRGAKGEVSRTPLLPAMQMHRTLEVAVPGAGQFAVDVVRDGHVVGGGPVLAREKRCLDGKRTISLSAGPSTTVWSSFPGSDATLVFGHHVVLGGDGIARIEWWRGGKRVSEEERTLSRDVDAACPLAYVDERLEVPAALREKSAWEARIYERGAQAYSLSYARNKITVKAIATPAKLAFEAALDPKVAAQATALRAKLRGTKDGSPFTDADLPVPAAAPPLEVKASAEPKLRLPKLPAISPDGATIAYDDEVEFFMFEGQCSPPAGSVVAVAAVGKDLPAPAVPDLSRFEPLQCGVEKLAGGYKAVEVETDSYHWKIVDPKGATVADLDGSGGNHASLCYSPKHKVAVLMVHGGVGGDCDVVGGNWPVAAKY